MYEFNFTDALAVHLFTTVPSDVSVCLSVALTPLCLIYSLFQKGGIWCAPSGGGRGSLVHSKQ